MRAERVLRAVERALGRAVESRERAREAYESHEAKVRAEGVHRSDRRTFEERWLGNSGYSQLQAQLVVAREQHQAAQRRLIALTNGRAGRKLPGGGPTKAVPTVPAAPEVTAIPASTQVPESDESKPADLQNLPTQSPMERLDVVPVEQEGSAEGQGAVVPRQPAHSDDRPALLLARNPLGEPQIEARVCPVCLRKGLAEGRTRHQRCEGQSLAQDSANPPSSVLPRDGDRIAYRELVRSLEAAEDSGPSRTEQTIQRLKRRPDARKAVLVRSGGRCENPDCGGQPADVTDSGQPILEVDHIVELAAGGRDHPQQMVALCPNCHAVKTRGRSREALRSVLLDVARQRHQDLT
ncbi:HNH endonuclease [Streptomyces sp. NPDC059447]|uniref:HNH endonuclease n=1 Tax=Streptomyces sp. NPDC059447 TaxID=3346834 RepID=UPI0036AF7873